MSLTEEESERLVELLFARLVPLFQTKRVYRARVKRDPVEVAARAAARKRERETELFSRIKAWVSEHPGRTSWDIRGSLRCRAADLYSALPRMVSLGLLKSYGLGVKGSPFTYTVG